MTTFAVGDHVKYHFEDSEVPGECEVEVVRIGEPFVTGQRYNIRIVRELRPSTFARTPKVGSIREVVEMRLRPL